MLPRMECNANQAEAIFSPRITPRILGFFLPSVKYAHEVNVCLPIRVGSVCYFIVISIN